MREKLIVFLTFGMILAALSGCAAGSKKTDEAFSVENLHCMIDLHLHLDGAISPGSARMLAGMQGIAIPASEEELLSLLRVGDDCRDLNEFLEKFDFPCSLLQSEEGIRQAVHNLLDELQKEGVMYAEIRFAPQKSTGLGLTQDEVIAAAISGTEGSEVAVNFILCCMRGNDDATREGNLETVRMAEKYLGKGVAAVDLAGAEALFPTADFEEVFALAKEKGIPFTIHAGEADGPESIRTALSFGALRIGHGVRACDDTELLKQLADAKIPLELCPTSNINTAIVSSVSEWPLKTLMDAGIRITINTDDPAIENTSIKKEYTKLIGTFGIGKAEVRTFLLNAAEVSFADDAQKKEMTEKILSELRD